MSLLDTASLIVTPNGYKEGKLYSVIPSDGSGDMSVTRATTATRVNSAGLVELVPYNLVQYSEQFDNAYWNKYQLSVTANNTTAPNGTNTADLITQTGAGAGTFYVYPFDYVNGLYTSSCYFKKGTSNVALIEGNPTSSAFSVSFNLDTEVITINGVGTVSADIESVENGWYRCSVVANVNASTGYVAYGLLGSVNDTMYVWGTQLVEGSTALPYQKTETRLNIPRLDYSNGTCPSILVEPQRTNSLLNSNQFNGAAWGGLGIASFEYVSNPITGMSDAMKITKVTGNTDPFFQQGLGAANGTWTLSMWLWTDSGQPTTAAFYMFNGSVTEFYAQSITLTNVPTRYTFTNTFANTGGLIIVRTVLSQADANQYIYAYGGQVEFGSYATSYIPTTSASVTRNADVVSKTGISSLIGQTEGTLFVDFYNYANNSTTTGCPICIANGGFYGNAIYIEQYLGNWYAVIWNGTSQQFISSPLSLTEGRHKLAIAYKTNDIVFYSDGVLVDSDSSATIPTCNGAYIGAVGSSTTPEQLAVNASALWKTRLTNTQLAQLTTI